MAEPICEDDGTLQEWSPMTRLLQQIPLKIQKGIFSHNLSLTCLDVASEYIALGTNCGFIYWYSRVANDLQCFRLENTNNVVTCVKIVSTVDYMVAAGTNHGNVTIYQIQKSFPNSIPESLKPKKKRVERFTINGVHHASVSSIEWSQNGMKLFTGDKNGLVVLTEIDFYMHLTKSTELLNEQFEIVQINYSQQILLISTTFRSIICDGHDKWKVHQVGTKERKILGKFGSTFYKRDNELMIYASRPGHRLWLSNANGSVQQTLLFKSSIPSSYPRIQLINPINKNASFDTCFGKLTQFGNNKIIAYNSDVFYVLHLGAISVVASLDSARKIIDLSVNEDEIFVLEGERSLLRISYTPDKYSSDDVAEEPSRRSFIFDEFASKLKDTAVESFKKITSELIITPDQMSPGSPPVLADEALNLPPIVNLPSGSISSIIPEDNVEVFFSVDDDECNNGRKFGPKIASASLSEVQGKDKELDEVICRSIRRRMPRKKKMLSTLQGHESESDTASNASEDRLVWGIANELSISEESCLSLSQSQSSFSILRDIPTLLSANSTKCVMAESMEEGKSKTSDNKSQASLDTCESVSENLLLTPERFLEEQEKTFYRLANQDISLLDSYNSEKTDDMSISLNMTPSSSLSSKISENAQSNSELSENVSMVLESKTENSESSNVSQNDLLPLPKHLCFYSSTASEQENVSSQENKQTMSGNTSVASDDSQPVLGSDSYNWTNDSLIATEQTVQPCRSLVGNSIDVEIYSNDSVLNFKLAKPNATEEDFESFTNTNFLNENAPLRNNEGNRRVANYPSISIFQENTDDKKIRNDQEKYNVNGISLSDPFGSALPGSSDATDCRKTLGCLYSSSELPSDCGTESGHWLQYTVPGPIACLAAGDEYVVCSDAKEQVYFSEISGLSLSWNLLPYEASSIRLSNDTSIVWILHKETLFSLISSTEKGLLSEEMLLQNSNVKWFSIDNENPEAWVVKTNGKVQRHRNLLGAPVGVPEDVPCDWLLTNITCWNGVVLAITSEESVVCKLPDEERFRSILAPKPVIRFVELGPDNLAWVVDERNNIYFSDDFLNEEPHWWQILISDYILQNSSSLLQNLQKKIKSSIVGAHKCCTMIATNKNCIWVYDKFSTTVKINKTSFTGYIWNKPKMRLSLPLIRWQLLSANGTFENKGRIWMLSSSGDIFCSPPDCKNFQSVSAPCEEIRCISSSTDVLWVLSSDGRLFSRLGLTNGNLTGSSWKELHLPEIDNLHLVWISCGCDVAWGCDSRGRIFATVDSPHRITTNVFDSAWLEVDGRPQKDSLFEKVFVGPHLYMVWAIDNQHNVYVREGIFPHFQIGTDWVLVAGLEASILTVSSTSVWALSLNGSMYCRCGISESNYIGDFWKQIPGTLKYITSSFTDGLWGIDHNNAVVQLLRNTKTLFSKKTLETVASVESDMEDNWEMAYG